MAAFDLPKNRILPFLQRAVGYANIDPTKFAFTESLSSSASENTFRITCKSCGSYQEQVVCDWSDNFMLDNLVDTVVEFSKSHEHPVVVKVVEEEFVGRKFRY